MSDPTPPATDAPPLRVSELVVNVDDTSPEVLGAAVQSLLDAGALDVWTAPITMKKNRPAVMLSLLCDEADRPRLAELTLRLTGSFGVRHRTWDRTVLQRQHVTVTTRIGELPIKVGSLGGRAIVAQPEWDAVAQAAEQHRLAPRQAMQIASAAADAWLADHGDDADGGAS